MAKGFKHIETHATNPSVGVGKTKWIFRLWSDSVTKTRTATNKDTAEVVSEFEYEDETKKGWYLKDNHNFVKFFRESSDDVRKLNTASVKVLMYAFDTMVRDSDVIVLEYKQAEIYYTAMGLDIDCSEDTFRRGILGLIEAGLIYRKTGGDNRYFVNVNKFFVGERTKLQLFKDVTEKMNSKDKGHFDFGIEEQKRLRDIDSDMRHNARVKAGLEEVTRLRKNKGV